MKATRNIVIAGVLSALAVSQAQAQVDLSAVTDELEGVGTAVGAAAGGIAAAALALVAIKFGGKWLVGLFRSFSK